MKKALVLIMILSTLLFSSCFSEHNSNGESAKKVGVANNKSNPIGLKDWDKIISSKVTEENFADKYYRCLLDETSSGSWTQEDITFFLNKCIEKDIEKNGEESDYYFLKNNKTPFLYVVNTITSTSGVDYYIVIEDEARQFPNVEFIRFSIIINYDSENYQDLNSYILDPYTFGENNSQRIVFNDTDEFIDFINENTEGLLFFERGWLEIN